MTKVVNPSTLLGLPPEAKKATCQVCGRKRPIKELLKARNGKLTCKKCNRELS